MQPAQLCHAHLLRGVLQALLHPAQRGAARHCTHALTGCTLGCSLHVGLHHAQCGQQGLTHMPSRQGSVLCLLQGLAGRLLSKACMCQEGMLVCLPVLWCQRVLPLTP